MSESLVLRVKRLITSGANSVVDAIELAAPESIMREAIREIERAIDDVRDELVQTVAAGHHARRRLTMARAKLQELEEKACLAVAQQRDDLAQVALSRQLDIEERMPDLEATIRQSADKQIELDGFIAALGQRKKEMEADQASFAAARPEASDAAPGGTGRNSVQLRAERARNAFDRAFTAGAGHASSVGGDRDTAIGLVELDRMARDVAVAERLAAIKATRQAV